MIAFRIGALMGMAATLFAGCAGMAAPSTSETAPVAVTGKEMLWISDPALADSADTLLSALGWGDGRFPRELKKEMAYQFNRRGVAVTEDTAKADAVLKVFIAAYARNGSATRFTVEATLKTSAGERKIGIQKAPKGAEAPERDDATVDNIRSIAASLVEGAGKDPRAEARKKKKQSAVPEYNPGLMLIF